MSRSVLAAINKEPAMAIAGILAGVSIVMPYVVVPIRRSLGYPTYQWDADPTTHPFINDFGNNYRTHSFSDPRLLAKWSQHGEYQYSRQLEPQARDNSEAIARRAARAAAAEAAAAAAAAAPQ